MIRTLVLRRTFLALAGLLFGAAPGTAAAQEIYPSRAVTIIVPFGAGTAVDLLTRLLAAHMQQAVGRPFVVENRPGGGGMIGANVVARAAPDGYTILVTTNSTHSVVRGLFKNVPYDPIKDFTPIGKLARLTTALVVAPGLPTPTMGDFVSYARANPGKIEFGFGNSTGQIGGEMLKSRTGIDIVAVNYKSNVEVIQGLLGGHIKSAVIDLYTAGAHINTGKLRPVALLSQRRSRFFPDIPTAEEGGVAHLDITAWAGVMAPAGVPRAVVDLYVRELPKFLARPDTREKLLAIVFEPDFIGGDDFHRFLVTELERWTGMAATAGIAPQ